MERRSVGVRELCATALMSALMAVSAFLTVPVGAVSFTLQIFSLYFALYFLGGRGGTLSVLVYLSVGAVGLPVFSGFRGGVGALFDVGGGFLFGFLIAAAVYWLLEAAFGKGQRTRLISTVISLALIYLSGVIWYSVVYLGSLSLFGKAFLLTVAPFIALDAIKIVVAWLISLKLGKVIKI